MPESLVRGAYGITSLAHLIIQNGQRSKYTIWNAMETYLSKTGNINAQEKIARPVWIKGELKLEHFLKSYAHPTADLIKNY